MWMPMFTLALLCFVNLAVGSQPEHKQRERRSSDFQSFDEILNGNPARLQIQNTDCHLKRKGGCKKTYTVKSGSCTMDMVLSQLFPGVNLLTLTNEFIVPAKFSLQKFEINKCEGNNKFETVHFKAKSTESVELIPQQLTLASQTELSASWKYKQQVVNEKLAIKLKGKTSIGNNHEVAMEVEKKDTADYDLKIKLNTLNVGSLLTKFGIDSGDMIETELNQEKRSLGITALVMQKPKIEGVFSPGGGFEITAKGRIVAPSLAADASKFYVIVQDFKDADANAAEEGFAKPIAAIFALYKGKKVPDVLMALSGVAVPDLGLFENVKEVAISAASKEIFNINSDELRTQAENYRPIKGLDMMTKGLVVSHYVPNSNEDIRGDNNMVAERLLFRCDITNEKLTWTSPQRIETQMFKLANLAWTNSREMGLFDIYGMRPDMKGVLTGIDFIRDSETVQFSFNLTAPVPVLSNGIVSLLNATITLYTTKKSRGSDEYEKYRLSGSGRETILDELVDITIENTGHRTNVKADANIFDMGTLRNRTKAEPITDRLSKTFKFILQLPIERLKYEASFQWNKVLRFKGIALVDRKPNLEILYFITNNGPQLKVGLHFKNTYLHKVVNMFYDVEMMKSTWMKFKKIGVVFRQERHRDFRFDRMPLRNVDEMTYKKGLCMQTNQKAHSSKWKFTDMIQSYTEGGVAFIAEDLDVRECRSSEWKMCSFLRLHFRRLNLKYIGRLLLKQMKMKARMQETLNLGTDLVFGNNIKSKMSARKGGGRLVFESDVCFARSSECFPGKIYDDGTNRVMLEFGGTENDESSEILGLNYVTLRPVRGNYEIPTDKKIETVELRSRMHVGTDEDKAIELPGGTGRQYIQLNRNRQVKFVGEKSHMEFKRILKAFSRRTQHKQLKKANFAGQVVAAYNSIDEVWKVPEFNVKVDKGFHLYGKLSLTSGQTYDATVNMLDGMVLETRLSMPPLRYGNVVKDSDGGKDFSNINLFLSKNAEESDIGPTLIYTSQGQFFEGYCETIGLEGTFTNEVTRRREGRFDYKFKVRGKLYGEVEDAEVVLTTAGVDNPQDFVFTYELDLTQQAKANVNNNLREALADVKAQATKGKESAAKKLEETTLLLKEYTTQHEGHTAEMQRVQEQIQTINSDVDMAVLDISTDCIDKCKTVSMPGIEWKQDCLGQAQGQRNMKCMTWSEDKEKVVNVVCLLKCEAKKVSAAGMASEQLQEIRLLLNRYRETKIMSENVGKLIELVKQANDIATETKELVDNKADIETELSDLLSQPDGSSLVEIRSLRIREDLTSLSPPCLPFQLSFELNAENERSGDSKQDICFNGEFYKNVGVQILRTSYPTVDELFKALAEAELRYAKINAVEKSLERVSLDIEKESTKRGKIIKPKRDLLEAQLLRLAERRIPRFTAKGDKTTMAFHYYSPWATAKRSNPFSGEFAAENIQQKYNNSAVEGQPACHQARKVIAEYKDIADSLSVISDHYTRGKEIYGKSSQSIQKELESSRTEILKLMNKTSLSALEHNDMMYWYEFTRKGMADYLTIFSDRLSEQSKRGLAYLRSELSSYYGNDDFVDMLRETGHKAYSRTNIPATAKHTHLKSLKKVGKELHRLLFEESRTLDDASFSVGSLNGRIERLYHAIAACY